MVAGVLPALSHPTLLNLWGEGLCVRGARTEPTVYDTDHENTGRGSCLHVKVGSKRRRIIPVAETWGKRAFKHPPRDTGLGTWLRPSLQAGFCAKILTCFGVMGKGIAHFPPVIPISRLYTLCDQTD